MASGELFPCIVCQCLTNSMIELHQHQRSCHTSEELSLSVICLVQHMSLQQYMGLKLKGETLNQSIDQSYSIEYRYKNTCIERRNIAHNDAAKHFTELQTNILKPSTYIPIQINYEKPGSSIEMQSLESTSDYYSRFSTDLRKNEVQENVKIEMSENLKPTSWELELNKVKEISDETFVAGVDGICQDLKKGIKRTKITPNKNTFRKPKKINKKNENKMSDETKFQNKKEFYPENRLISWPKNIRTSQGDNISVNYNTMNDETKYTDPLKLVSLTQDYHHKDLANIKFQGGTKGGKRNETPQEVAALFFNKEIPILAKPSNIFNSDQEMPVLQPNCYYNELTEAEISKIENNAKMSNVDYKTSKITVNLFKCL